MNYEKRIVPVNEEQEREMKRNLPIYSEEARNQKKLEEQNERMDEELRELIAKRKRQKLSGKEVQR